MPIVLSMCHGGICRVSTRDAMAFAHGRTCSYVINDIGAIDSGRWHDSHFSWKIGAMSLVKVGDLTVSADGVDSGTVSSAAAASTLETSPRRIRARNADAINLLVRVEIRIA